LRAYDLGLVGVLTENLIVKETFGEREALDWSVTSAHKDELTSLVTAHIVIADKGTFMHVYGLSNTLQLFGTGRFTLTHG
jgi:hypothetical protein